jgi:sugar/nucleoside kinase (ribokinase family)
MPQLDVLALGNATIDVFLTINEDNPHVKLDQESHELRFGHGEKIEVGKHDISVGGNATNVAVGISRLGFNSGLVAEIGNDEFSQKILNCLKDENVNSELDIQTDNKTSSLTVGINFKKDRTLFVEHIERNHNFDYKNFLTKIFYLTSLGPIWERAYEKALEYVEKNNIQLIFNPGTLQIEKKNSLTLRAISKSDILFVNKEEAEELLYGKEVKLPSFSENYVKKLMYGLKSFGPKNIIITDGQKGSYLMDNDHNTYFLNTIPCEIVEKTGAGDAYTSGFISAILNGETLQQAMRWGSFNSMGVISEIGAEKGLLTKALMSKRLEENKEFKVKEI